MMRVPLMKTAGLWFALVASCNPAAAKPRHWYTDKKFWIGEAIIGVSQALDAHSTCRGFARGAVEANFALKGNRSCGVEAGVMAGGFVFYSAFNIAENDVAPKVKNRVISDAAPWIVPAAAAGIHVPAAIHNYTLKLPEPKK